MKRAVEVTQRIEVEVDESKFTPEFMAEFRASFYRFDTLDQHIEHLAQLSARGVANLDLGVAGYAFVEGYGDPVLMGICCRELSVETEIEPARAALALADGGEKP